MRAAISTSFLMLLDNATTAAWPFFCAMSSGVVPFSVARLTSAPRSKQSRTTSTWPFKHATQSGVDSSRHRDRPRRHGQATAARRRRGPRDSPSRAASHRPPSSGRPRRRRPGLTPSRRRRRGPCLQRATGILNSSNTTTCIMIKMFCLRIHGVLPGVFPIDLHTFI